MDFVHRDAFIGDTGYDADRIVNEAQTRDLEDAPQLPGDDPCGLCVALDPLGPSTMLVAGPSERLDTAIPVSRSYAWPASGNVAVAVAVAVAGGAHATQRVAHENLDVYQISIDFLALAMQARAALPRGYADMGAQLERAALSVVLKIAEG